MTSEKICRKEKNQNIQVFVRLRPLNQRERDIKSLGVIEVVNNREVVVRQSQQTSHTKKFTFDRAFSPAAKQVEIYQDVVSPLIEEVLAGYNCTVFAYGQTGTGKTHTMVGENSGDETTWQTDPLAGIIPRALSQLFDELRISNTEYTVRVSYLELYNEELFDLLSSSEDNSKLRIYEDVTRKGSNIVNGLEEITVYNKNEVYKIMAQGQERKRVASTLMNAQSSNHQNGKEMPVARSHTVFTIVVHMKENSPEGEELVKIGKLNLVDLAGSENISKAGSDNPAKRERARECVNINQSLLTLGRVITALVERHPHIPYRESKLTRILQESLGGRTKTSIIATISPGHKDLEETMSTLEYAHRAKNIQNKPEVNQKMTKKAILKEYAEEIDKLKRDLQAARDKNGVYLASDTFAEMTLKQEEQRKEIQELLLKKRAMEEERDRLENVFSEINNKLEKYDEELSHTRSKLNSTEAKLADTNNALKTTRLQYSEQRHLVATQQQTEQKLSQQAKQLVAVADTASQHALKLHDTVDRRRSVESSNLQITQEYRAESAQQRERISAGVQHFTDSLLQTLNGLHSTLDNFTTSSIEMQEQNRIKLSQLAQNLIEATNEIKSLATSTQTELTQSTSTLSTHMHASACGHVARVAQSVAALVAAAGACVASARGADVAGDVARFVQQWFVGASARVTSLQKAHGTFCEKSRDTECRRADASRRQRDARRAHAGKRAGKISACIVEIQEEKALIEQRLSKQMTDIENERQETELRLNQWMEEERKLLEERLARHVATEKKALENRLSKKLQEIEEERTLLEERITRHMLWQEEQLEANKEELESAEKDLEECDGGKEECLKNMGKFNKEFDEGTSAVSIDMEVFSKNVVEVVEHIHQELVRTLQNAQQHVQQEADSIVTTDKETMQQLTSDTDALLGAALRASKQTLDTVVNKIEANHSTSIEELASLSASSTELVSSLSGLLSSQTLTLENVQHETVGFSSSLQQAVERHRELEARYLTQEYKVYSPTGNTPRRAEYRYPRELAATSPHERVLARFRAGRCRDHVDEEDCVVLESDSEPSSQVQSDNESLSEEPTARAVFLQPSPPAQLGAIVKCTSESDIYNRRKQQDQQGKENANRSISHKKPSRLPAPASHKKPLVERNTSGN